jgi:histidyl-tRNA synthetase
VQWTRNPRLVRGLDYYRHTAFEFVTDRLGAQGTVLAGGRYDGLVESLGGAPTAGVGWAAGVERLAMLLDEPASTSVEAVVIPMGAAAEQQATGLLADLRRAGLTVDMSFRGNMKKRLAKADAQGAEVVFIIGEDELVGKTITVKLLGQGLQESWPFAKMQQMIDLAAKSEARVRSQRSAIHFEIVKQFAEADV